MLCRTGFTAFATMASSLMATDLNDWLCAGSGCLLPHRRSHRIHRWIIANGMLG